MVSIKASFTKMKEMLGREVTLEELDKLLSFGTSEIADYVKEEDMLVIDIKTANPGIPVLVSPIVTAHAETINH